MAREKAKNPAEYSVEDKLRNLYKLQEILSERDRLKALRGELPEEVGDLEDEIQGLNTRVSRIEGEIASLKKEISERNGNVEVNKANIARYKEQMDAVRNNREYDNLSKQIEYAELDNVLNEKKINEAKAAVESKTAEMISCNMAINDRRVDLEIKKGELEDILRDIRDEYEKLGEQAKNIEVTIEPRLRDAFIKIRQNSRNGLGVVYVQRDACGGCFNKIPPQRQLDIRMRKKVIVCEYCGRILVDPELAGVQIAAKGVEEKKRTRRTRKKTEEE